MVINNCRSFEESLNRFLQSCIPDSNTYLVSFAHNENAEEQTLKYELHSFSVGSLNGFHRAFSEGLAKIANASGGVISYKGVDTPSLGVANSLLAVKDIFPGYTSSASCQKLCVGFDFFSSSATEAVFVMELGKFRPKEEQAFVSAYSEAFGWKSSVSSQRDKSIYKDKDWCWGERYTLSFEGIEYTGDPCKDGVLKSFLYPTAKLNVVQYAEPHKMGEGRELMLNGTVSMAAAVYDLGKSLFEGNHGCYACTSAVQEPFTSNPFNVDVKAVSRVSTLVCDVLGGEDFSVSGWRIYDDQKGKFRFEVSACDRDYNSVASEIAPIVFNSNNLKVFNSKIVKSFYGDKAVAIVRGILSVIKSLSGFDIPIDLLEVCLFGAKYSEESYDDDDDQTCVWDKMGSFSNTSHVVEGLSVICEKNGFDGAGRAVGKYAMVVVL